MGDDCRCDNAAVVAIIRLGKNRHPLVAHLMRSLSLFTAVYKVTLMAEHLPGKQNEAADVLSRDNCFLFFYQVPTASREPPQELRGTRLDLEGLENSVRKYFTMGLAPSALHMYRSGKVRYTKFCQETGDIALPVCESVLCRFCVHLAMNNLSYWTIKAYLSAVHHMQIAAAQPDPFTPMSKSHYVLKVIKRKEAMNHREPQERLPITSHLLKQMRTLWQAHTRINQGDIKMLWAACCVCFFAFLRVGEMLVPSNGGYDPAVHLNISNIAVDNCRTPSVVKICIKQSKTNPFRRGISLFVGSTLSDLCPVAALVDYIQVRGMKPSAAYMQYVRICRESLTAYSRRLAQ